MIVFLYLDASKWKKEKCKTLITSLVRLMRVSVLSGIVCVGDAK